MKTALIAGATGLVGGELLRILLARPEYDRVVAIGRRKLDVTDPKLAQLVADFDRLDEAADAFRVDDVFCSVGTTLKKAGSQAAQRRVDYDYQLAVARGALAGGARQFLLVSSMGADPKSTFFYNRIKGELERDVAALGLPSVRIFRPSLLLGERQEVRRGERIAVKLSPYFGPLMPARVRPILARDVAMAMVHAALGPAAAGVHIYLNDEVQRLARG
ncbi:MAG TPA: oxidoreductase [Symbiobacteriaceae bacterium]|nr:oxidoreductase [Symbiobacteriaceae bacterium]